MPVENVKLNKILPNPFQTRLSEDPEHVKNLAQSIKTEGLLQIPLGRKNKFSDRTGLIELAFGHSRLAAFKLLAEDDESFDTMQVAIAPLSNEEMFTKSVAENNSRKDLSPIETARAMITYRDQFGKTSKEIGELFHLSPSAVRNKIRLLDLPEPAQEKIDQGEITEGSARSLLQLQRINPEKLEAVIEKTTEEPHTTVELDRVVTNEITNSRDTHQMHERWLAGEPRAGRNLWLLSEWIPVIFDGRKEYFEDIRPMLKKVEAFKALSFEAFTAMQELLMEDPLAWEQKYAKDHTPRDLEIFRVMAEQRTTCSTCPLHLVKNRNHYCGFKPCWSWRKRKYESQILAEKSAEMGIAVYARSDGKFDHIGKYHDWNTDKYRPEIEKLFSQWVEKKSDCLRLKIQSNQYNRNKFTDDPSIAVVCVGEAAFQKIQDIVESVEERKVLSEWKKREIREEASEKFITEIVVPFFSPLFKGLPIGLFRWITGNDDSNLEHFTKWIIRIPVSWGRAGEGPTLMAETYREAAEMIGLDPPEGWIEKTAEYEPKFEDLQEDT